MTCGLIGLGSGALSALFLSLLGDVTEFREHNEWLILMLPLGGMIISACYVFFGKNSLKGNNLVITQAQEGGPTEEVPFRLALLALFGTLTSHLFGGSVGREGTAVQMGGAVASVVSCCFNFSKEERSLLFICGISAGFSSVFGTPLAGALFSIEVLALSSLRLGAVIPSLITAFWANQVAVFLGATHTRYQMGAVPVWSIKLFIYLVTLGIVFGLISRLFTTSLFWFKRKWQDLLPQPIIRTGIGGLVVIILIFLSQTTRYTGLSLGLLTDAFEGTALPLDFLNKLVLTVSSLSVGFQGGEVTPLFEIGASLGSTLGTILNLPVGFAAALGFIGVFAGATNAPLASFIMGLELFGYEASFSLLLICLISYAVSSRKGIYSSQKTSKGKFRWLTEL